MDTPNLVAIVDRSETRLRDAGYTCCGVSVELYQFSCDTTKPRNNGHIFRGNTPQDLSFEENIAAVDANNKRDAAFFVHEVSSLAAVEDMMTRSAKMKDVGILNLYVGGYNTQISKPVSGFHIPTRTFAEWLAAEELAAKELADQGLAAQEPPSTTIPVVVKQLLRTGYQGIETMWARGSTSDFLADPSCYLMVGSSIKIDPLRIRNQNQGEKKKRVRNAFGTMIETHIYKIWQDEELLDLVFLLGLQKAGAAAVQGAPVLLLPPKRELMYSKYAKLILEDKDQWSWLLEQTNLGPEWKDAARNEDVALKSIIDNQPGAGFLPTLRGALCFGGVVTSHYQQHVKGITQDDVGMKNRVDSVLKKALPRLLSRRYNADYV